MRSGDKYSGTFHILAVAICHLTATCHFMEKGKKIDHFLDVALEGVGVYRFLGVQLVGVVARYEGCGYSLKRRLGVCVGVVTLGHDSLSMSVEEEDLISDVDLTRFGEMDEVHSEHDFFFDAMKGAECFDGLFVAGTSAGGLVDGGDLTSSALFARLTLGEGQDRFL